MSQQHPTGPYAFGERIERVVAFHAERTPDAVAVQQGDRTLGYAELTARAGQVAGSLAAAGVGPGDVVPVLIRRSPELVVALLGVLHAGAAYVAVDPAWPQERIGEVVRHRGRAPVLTADALGPPGGGSAPPPAYSDGTQAACVFFTSGSTGRPKGAVSPHRGTVRTLVGCPTVPLDRNTVFLQAAPLPWDGLSLELWAPLLNGGRCVLLEPGVRAPDSTSLGAAVADGVNSLWLTSALFTVLADETPDVFAHLRLLLVGGERVPASPVRRVLRRFPGLHMVNGYGPAESTIFATTHVIRPADVAGPGDDIPIGRPVPRTTVALLAPDGKPVGPGETGEIAIGGDGLALGYLGDPEQTAASFYGSGPDRYYRTGDLACRDDEGNLRFRGRADRQFKIRGFRVEPGEVEAAVEAHPRVSACCAVKVETSRQRHEIVCVYATAAAGPVDPAELRALVARRLPDALVPTAFRHVPRLPRTVNGKVDRSAVRALLRPQPAAAPPAPGVDAVTATVREMLGRPGLTDHDDLLDAGLNSLDAVRLASRVATTTGARITVGDVYRLRTLAALRAADPAPPGPAPAPPRGHGGPAPLSRAQARFWLAEQAAPGAADNLIVLAYALRGPLIPSVLAAAVHDVVARHPVLRTVYPWHDDMPVQHVVDRSDVKVPVDLVDRPSGGPGPALRDRAEEWTRDWWSTPFSLEDEIPVRARIVRLGSDLHVLCLQMHHIAFDGWSERLVMDGLRSAYASRLAGRPPEPDDDDGYAALSRWESVRTDAWRREELPYWRRALADPPAPFLPVPGERAEAPRRESVVSVGAETVSRLARLTGRRGGPVAAALVAAAARALARTFEVSDLCVGTATAGRHTQEAETAVGYCVNPLAVPLRSVPHRDDSDLLAHCTERVVAALRHSRTPFDELVRELRPARTRHPWFQVWVVLQGEPPHGRFGDGIEVESLRVRPPLTSLELMIEAVPRPGGSWEVVVLRRADGLDDGSAAGLVHELRSALHELAELAD